MTQIRNCVDATPGAPGACTGTGAKDAQTNLITSYAYDDAGRMVSVTAPDPSATDGASTATVTTRSAYDAVGRLCRVLENATITDAAWTTAGCTGAVTGTTTTNLSTRYTYDAAGNLASMIDAAGHTTAYTYDAAGRLLTTTDADGGVLRYAYDELGQRIRSENRTDPPLTASVTWTYDAAGRMATRTANSVTTSYGYDDSGNRRTASDGTLLITATYDRLNRVLTVDDEDAGTTADTTTTYSLTNPSWTDPTGIYAVTLDKFDRATVLDDPVNGSNFTWTWRADGQPSSIGAPNGNTIALAYDNVGHLTGKTTTAPGPINRAAYGWTHNRAGSILSEATAITGDPTNNTRTFGYDPLGRLATFEPYWVPWRL